MKRAFFLLVAFLLVGTAAAQNLVIIANRTLIDNTWILGKAPVTGGQVLLTEADPSMIGLDMARSRYTSTAAGGVMTGNPNLTFADVGNSDTIVRASGSWVSDGFAVGQMVYVKKGGSSNQTVRKPIASITQTSTADDTLVFDSNTSFANEDPANGYEVRGARGAISSTGFLRPSVAGLALDGNQAVDWDDSTERTLALFGASYGDGVALPSVAARIESVCAQNFRGAGIRATQSGTWVHSSVSENNWIGVLLGGDCELHDTPVTANRDLGVWVVPFAGNAQVYNCHVHGTRIACLNNGDYFRFIGGVLADSYIGLLTAGPHTVVSGVLFQHNHARDAILWGPGEKLVNCTILKERRLNDATGTFNVTNTLNLSSYTPTYSVELNINRQELVDCKLELSSYVPNTGTLSGTSANLIWIRGGLKNIRIDGCTFNDNDSVNGAAAITVANGIEGLYVRAEVHGGFAHSTDRLLVFGSADATNVDGLDIVIRGPGLKTETPEDHIDIDDGWTGSITLIDTTDGSVSNISEGAAL